MGLRPCYDHHCRDPSEAMGTSLYRGNFTGGQDSTALGTESEPPQQSFTVTLRPTFTPALLSSVLSCTVRLEMGYSVDGLRVDCRRTHGRCLRFTAELTRLSAETRDWDNWTRDVPASRSLQLLCYAGLHVTSSSSPLFKVQSSQRLKFDVLRHSLKATSDKMGLHSAQMHLRLQVPTVQTAIKSGNIDILSPLVISLAETTSTSSTLSVAVGVGSTMDKLIGYLGGQLTSFVSRIAERHLKKARPVRKISVQTASWEGNGADGLRINHLLPWASECRDEYATRLSQSKEFNLGCDKLVKGLRLPNTSVRLLTAYYICALASFHHSIRQIFVEVGAAEALHELVHESRVSGNQDVVLPLRRSLISVTESAILPVIKGFDALEDKFQEYYHQHLSIKDITALLPYSASSLRYLMRGLLEPQLQVVTATRLSSSLVWHDLSLTSVLPALRSSLDENIVRSLWHILSATSDPVVSGTVGRLIYNLYDFATKSCFNQWDLSRQCYVPSAEWAWRTLWMPLFYLRLCFPNVIQRLSPKYLSDTCDLFFKWHVVALSMSVQARGSIDSLRPCVETCRPFRPSNILPEKDDPVLFLMLHTTNPLFALAGVLHGERLISFEYGGYDIPRFVPLPRVAQLCLEAAALLMSEQTPDDIATSPSMLHMVAPQYDTAGRQILLEKLEQYGKQGSLLQRNRIDAILKCLDHEDPESVLHCIGIVADHYRGPWTAERHYDRCQPYMHLLAQDPYHDLRWVAVSDLSGCAAYRPVVVPSHNGVRHIARQRNRPIEGGRLVMLTAQEMIASTIEDLHVLCGSTPDCPVFWMTRDWYGEAQSCGGIFSIPGFLLM
ncbi:hypothetical protein GLOTRDRAFT_96694 [Gloeophyllum trabeum ATCC 11539]|uniref:Uncharacterized protein n=1 Tax=Gloeophyllum trabeum (strain ATCC 11539 / FP-39264 / Madison 617) TaxID=670483 RepID=S7RF81_GLOTA|nr:uncharacterized protein GLOTRDRAFT_96694 [Gloeophyllum trabeum ATCC 11539]EPQ51164.1 hypothetical protein GLOTRDRAFT_96694 [Gloeophyllum trabeum ATCC 11539]